MDLLARSKQHEQSHIAHSQGLTNGLSDRDYRVLTINFLYFMYKKIYNNMEYKKLIKIIKNKE